MKVGFLHSLIRKDEKLLLEAFDKRKAVTLVMLEAIRDHFHASGVRIGMKPAGGISSAKLAIRYLVMVDIPGTTSQDQADLFAFLNEVPRPYDLYLFSLTYFPGSKIVEDQLPDLVDWLKAETPIDFVGMQAYNQLIPTGRDWESFVKDPLWPQDLDRVRAGGRQLHGQLGQALFVGRRGTFGVHDGLACEGGSCNMARSRRMARR